MPDHSISDEILILEEKREALERVISVVNSLETMAEGLKASMELGKSAEELPLTLLKAYNSLGKKIRNSSDHEILSKIETVDAIVKNKLNSIVLLTEDKSWAFFEEESRNHESSLFNEIDNFVRLTHTNIALRVLIEKRTGKTLPFQSLVTEFQIRKNVELIERSEVAGRKKVVEDITIILKDVNTLLAMPGLTGSMRKHLESVKGDLRQGLKHVISGKPIKGLPVDIAVMNLSPADDNESDTPSGSAPGALDTEMQRQEVSTPIELNRLSDSDNADVKTHADSTKEKSEDSQQEQKGITEHKSGSAKNVKPRRLLSVEAIPFKKSLWKRFCLWLDSPWTTSWRDLKGKGRKRK